MSFPVLLSSFGLAWTFGIYGIVGVIGSAFVLKFIPETRGRSLEQIEHCLRDIYRDKKQNKRQHCLNTPDL
jgi:major inositol transporter-like SP family MFS transporter